MMDQAPGTERVKGYLLSSGHQLKEHTSKHAWPRNGLKHNSTNTPKTFCKQQNVDKHTATTKCF